MTISLIKRLFIYNLGMLILAFGTAFTINSDLGVSPVSSLPFILSEVSGFNIGLMSAAFFGVLVLLQIIILGKNFKWINLIQLPFAFIFGYFLDFARWVLGTIQFPTYFGRLGMLIIGIILIAMGIVFLILARIIIMPPEALCQALSQRFPRIKFHIAKIVMDCAIVAISITISLSFLGNLEGIREGTVISAIAIGKIIPYIKKILEPIANKIIPHRLSD
ncbi:MAG: DUF6198 family protein [Defluviitaleaceae bacterium]|nr:DUF6198 family protein [Defluviitaleaceae bacterium]